MTADTPSGPRRVTRILKGMPASDGAGVRLNRVIATPELDQFDPFLLLDEFRSDDPDDYIAGFPDHPHRGFETVTYMLAGSMEHADNQGNAGLLGPGWVQWMTAGRGIVHSEMPKQEDGLMWGFQLWVNLPAKDKMRAPRYQDIPADSVPSVTPQDGVIVKVIAGDYSAVSGPVSDVAVEPLYLDARLRSGTGVELPVPVGHNAFVYVYAGAISLGGDGEQPVARGELALLGHGEGVVAKATEDARFLLIAGRPLEEPVARYGPFVMNTADQIRQAIVDFQSGRF